MKDRMVLMGFLVGVIGGCGTQPATLTLGDIAGSLGLGIEGSVNPDVNVNVDATVQADVDCTVVCDLNTGECETVCELGSGEPPTPEALGEELYVNNCQSCHGPDAGGAYGPSLIGETAADILAEWGDPDHPGGSFPDLDEVDADNLAAYFGSL